MPHEIPDSDEESDYGPGPRAAEPEAADISDGDGGLDVKFDDFISQTQSAKEQSSQPEPTKRSTASTQKHLREALNNQPGSASSSYDGANDIDQSAGDAQLSMAAPGQRKRAHSEIGDGHDKRGSSQNRRKRTKTYGASTPPLVLDQDLEESSEPANKVQTTFYRALAAGPTSQGSQEDDDGEDIVAQARDRPKRVISLLGDAVPIADHVLSTSNSSIGGYQSINMDFRGTGSGLDINANPFAALPEVYVEASIEHPMEGRRADLPSTVHLSASPQRPGRDVISPLTDAGFGPQPVSIDPSVLVFEPPDESQMQTSPVANTTTQILASAFATTSNYYLEDAQHTVETVSGDTAKGTASKKRGRNSKGSRQPSVALTQDFVVAHQEENEHAIGLPKEQYKPTPSKYHGGTIEPEHQSQHAEDEPPKKKGRKMSVKSAPKATEHSSPIKLPTSELNLDDEAIIGLPKENYKPRPSRRRSRMVVGDAEASIEFEIQSVDSHNQPAQSQQSKETQPSRALELVDAPTPKPKKSKKAKVKRAKTSAAGLLKKSEPMISDGEEDVVWMDTKPAKVKLNLPANPLVLKVVKEEESHPDAATVNQSQASRESNDHKEITETPIALQKIVTVEIPARAEKETIEPKKNGRKPKKTSEVVEDEDTEAVSASTPASRPLASSPSRPAASTALKEKDTNASLPPPTPNKQTTSSSPNKPAKITHSPINPNGGKVLYRVGLSRRSAIPPLLKIVKPPVEQQAEKQNLDEDGKPVDLVAETMKKWREMGVLD